MGRRPAKFHKSTGNAGGLAAGDLLGFLELRGGFFSTLSRCCALGEALQTTKSDGLSYLA
jgi:hypothetical protein